MAVYKIARSIAQNLDLYDKYTCPNCHHLCKDTVQSVCGHWLCESCADELMATSSPKCPRPDCQEDLKSDGDQCFPDHFVRREIARMMALCPYKGNGCQWEDKMAGLEAHLKTCTFASDRKCPLASLGCQHNQTGTKQELQKHVAECGLEHLQLMAGILSFLCPLLPSALLPSAISSESTSVVERDGVLTSKGSKTKRSALKHDDYGYQSRRIYSDEASTAAFTSELDTRLTTQMRKKDEEIETLKNKISSLERAMESKQAEYEDRDFRLSLIENSSHNGQMIWKIPQFSQSSVADAQSAPATGITVESPAQPASAGVQQLMDQYQLSTSQVDRKIQQKDVPYLAASFDIIELYVDAMELSPGEQQDVHKKPHTHIAMIECLKIWKSKKASQATFRALLEMLVKLKKEAIADEVCQYIKEIPTTSVGEESLRGVSVTRGQEHTTEQAVLSHITEVVDLLRKRLVRSGCGDEATEVDTLLSSNGLTYKDVNKECRDEHIFGISLKMENWELVAMRLGLTPVEIKAIKYNNQTIEMLRYISLTKWKSKNLLRGTATYGVLLQALLDCGCNDQAKQVCSLLKESVLYQQKKK